jgi:hypothetical protein
MNKKLPYGVLTGLLIFALVGCGKGTATVGTPSQSPVAAGTPEQGTLNIANTNAFVDSFGTYHVVGMVVNQTTVVLTSIELTIQIRDASGYTLLTDNGSSVQTAIFHPMLYTLAPGEGSPFEFSYDNSKGTPASYNVTVTGDQPGSANRANLTAENVQLVDSGSGWYYLTGVLVNKSNDWAHINILAGAVTDNSNKVLSADWTATYATELSPAGDPTGGDRTPFVINFPNPGTTSTPPWQLYWDSDIAQPVNNYPVSVTITNEYVDQYGSHHIVGSAINQSGQEINSMVVAGLYDQAGNALDANVSYLPIPMKAGASVPFSVTSFSNVDGNPAEAALVRTYTAQIDPWNTTAVTSEYVDLSATGETVKKDGSTWTVDGSVMNSSGRNLSSATVVVSVLDAQNNLVATEYTTIFSSGAAIAPDETNTYSITIILDPTIDSTGFTTTTTVVGDVSQ